MNRKYVISFLLTILVSVPVWGADKKQTGRRARYDGTETFKDCQKMIKSDWQITVKKEPGMVQCSCGYLGEPKIIDKRHDFTLFECPECGNLPKIIDGKCIRLKEVVVE